MKYVGMTSRHPDLRKQEWESQGRVISGFTVIYTCLTYDEALEIENRYRLSGYRAEPGGPRVPGNVYSVYVFEY